MSVATEFAVEFAPAVPVPERARPVLRAAEAVPVEAPRRGRAGSPPAARAATLPGARVATVTALCPPSSPPVAAPVRLTRRGVLVLAVAVALLGALLVGLAARSAPATPAAPAGPAVVTVAPGDTLWSIATRVAPHTDPRAEVATLQRLNHLRDVDLTPGQQLRVH